MNDDDAVRIKLIESIAKALSMIAEQQRLLIAEIRALRRDLDLCNPSEETDAPCFHVLRKDDSSDDKRIR